MKMTRLSTGNYETSFPIKYTMTEAKKDSKESEVKSGKVKAYIHSFLPDWSNKQVWTLKVEVYSLEGHLQFTENFDILDTYSMCRLSLEAIAYLTPYYRFYR